MKFALHRSLAVLLGIETWIYVTIACAAEAPRAHTARILPPAGICKQWTPNSFGIDFPPNGNQQRDPSIDGIGINVSFSEPSGSHLTVPAFLGSDDSGNQRWQCRFTPREIGVHTARLSIGTSREPADSGVSFEVAASDLPGFLRVNGDTPYTLVFDNGERFRGIGANIAWEPRRRRHREHTYDVLFPRIAARGLNTIRTWMCPWNLPLEWNSESLGQYDQQAAQRLDQMLALAEENEIYVVLVLGYHGELQTESGPFPGNDRWKENPYNAANGGPCNTPAEFFTDPRAKALYKHRLRYLVARIACHPHLLAWELWNEVDHIQRRGPVTGADIVSWHQEMADYIRSIDPYQHPITTSTSTQAPQGLWEIESLDLVMLHRYGTTEKLPSLLSATMHRFNKPVVAGEFSLTWRLTDDSIDEEIGHELRLGLWRGIMSPTPVLPMTWWWELHSDRDDWRYFSPVAVFSKRMTEIGQADWRPMEIATDSETLECRGIQIGGDRFLWMHNGGKTRVSNASVQIDGVAIGEYQVTQFDTKTGKYDSSKRLRQDTLDGTLALELPPLTSRADTAFIIEQVKR